MLRCSEILACLSSWLPRLPRCSSHQTLYSHLRNGGLMDVPLMETATAMGQLLDAPEM